MWSAISTFIAMNKRAKSAANKADFNVLTFGRDKYSPIDWQVNPLRAIS